MNGLKTRTDQETALIWLLQTKVSIVEWGVVVAPAQALKGDAIRAEKAERCPTEVTAVVDRMMQKSECVSGPWLLLPLRQSQTLSVLCV